MSASNLCPACGLANAPTNTFCVNCGTRLTVAAGPPAGPPPAHPTAAPMPYPSYPAAYPYPYAPAPMPRRANFSSILGAMFDVWSKNFLNFFVVFLLLSLVTGTLGALLSFAVYGTFEPGGGFVPGSPPPSAPSGNAGTLLLYAIATVVISVIISSVVTGGMTEYAVRRHRGESMTLRQALRRGLDKFLSILGANILLTLIVFALILTPLLLILPLALVAGSGSASAAIAVICGLFVALVVGGVVAVFVYISLSLYPPAIMMENERAIGGLSRSWAITKGYRWSLFGAIVITLILVAVITAAILIPAGLIRHPAAAIAASAVASGIVGSWILIVAAVAYDLIVRPPTWLYGTPPPYTPGFGVGPSPGVAPAPPGPPQAPPLAGP